MNFILYAGQPYLSSKQYNYDQYLLLLQQQMNSSNNTSSQIARKLPPTPAIMKKFYLQVLTQMQGLLKIHYQNRCNALTETQIDQFKQKVEELLSKPDSLFQAANNYTQSHTPTNQADAPDYSLQINTKEGKKDEIEIPKQERENDLRQGVRKEMLKVRTEKEMIAREKKVNTCRISTKEYKKQEKGTRANIESESQQQAIEEEDNLLGLTDLDYRITALYEKERYISKNQEWVMKLSDVFLKSKSGQMYISEATAQLTVISKKDVLTMKSL